MLYVQCSGHLGLLCCWCFDCDTSGYKTEIFGTPSVLWYNRHHGGYNAGNQCLWKGACRTAAETSGRTKLWSYYFFSSSFTWVRIIMNLFICSLLKVTVLSLVIMFHMLKTSASSNAWINFGQESSNCGLNFIFFYLPSLCLSCCSQGWGFALNWFICPSWKYDVYFPKHPHCPTLAFNIHQKNCDTFKP